MRFRKSSLLALAVLHVLVGVTHAIAQGTSFTYQGRLTDQGIPANGVYDLRFQVYDAPTAGNPVGAPADVNDLSLSNGLFTATLDPGTNVFAGPPRWLDIGVRSGTSLGDYTPVFPRQAVTPTPYAIKAVDADTATVASSVANGSITSASVAPGAIGSAQLAPGAAAANLAASDQSGVASGGLVLSLSDSNSALLSAGYVRISGSIMGDDAWRLRENGSPPSPRSRHTAIWTGNEMIVWGGYYSDSTTYYLNDGARYNSAADTWTAVVTNGAPSRRFSHAAVWTGSEMLVWGGFVAGAYLTDGGRYNLASDSWTPIATNGAASARSGHTVIWTGNEMIVWGGSSYIDGTNHYLSDGVRYNPTTDTWSAVGTNGAPSGRSGHSAVWTGSEMLVWGGSSNGVWMNEGGRYNPTSDTWTAITTNNAPSKRSSQTAVWTGTEMIVWGGGPGPQNTGGRYNPASDIWTPVTTSGAPAARQSHSAVWTGTEMIIWGGAADGGNRVNTGGRYDPIATSWPDLTVSGAPSARYFHTAVWTGSEMIVWGGNDKASEYFNDTWSYKPGKVMFLYQKP